MVVSQVHRPGRQLAAGLARDNRGKTGEAQESYRPITGFAVDAKTGSQDIVYIGAGRRQPGFTGANALPVSAVVAVSTDGGKTFGEPINLAESAFTDAVRPPDGVPSATTVPGATPPTTTAPAAG